jgi:hypothetical protein
MSTESNQPKPLDNRVFGLIFSGIFCVIGLFPLLFGDELRQWALIVAAAWALPALVYPAILAPLNRLWAKFGQVMHSVINPILMGLIFFLTVLPTGLILRLLGKDPMRRKFDTQAASYWILREQKSVTKDSFDNQF